MSMWHGWNNLTGKPPSKPFTFHILHQTFHMDGPGFEP